MAFKNSARGGEYLKIFRSPVDNSVHC